MLKSIEVENFRSFGQSARLELRPITILLGRNSAGKSSLTRLFPLFRQSMARETSSPILWTSTTNIDFGRIGDVLNRSRRNDELRVGFEIDTNNIDHSHYSARSLTTELSGLQGRKIKFNAYLGESSEGKTEYNSFEICIDSNIIRVTLNEGRFVRLYVNDKRIETKRLGSRVVVLASKIFPNFFFNVHGNESLDRLPLASREIDQALSYFLDVEFAVEDPRPIKNALATFTVAHFGETTASIPFLTRDELPDYLAGLPRVRSERLDDGPRLDALAESILITYFATIASFVGDSLGPIFRGVSYLGPIRSSGSRFYREQELSVDRIDETGANFATYITSLSSSELNSFNELLSSIFDVRIRSHSTVGHISLELARSGSDEFDNLADVGFGFSQLLPLVAQIHSRDRQRYSHMDDRVLQILAIEQPELHLHPAAQANLADLFVTAVSRKVGRAGPLNVVLETHSESLIARFGELIVDEKLDPKDIILHFVDKDEESGQSTVTIGEFDGDGDVKNWPLGFFSART